LKSHSSICLFSMSKKDLKHWKHKKIKIKGMDV